MCSSDLETRSVKVTLEEVLAPEEFSATVDGLPVEELDYFCTDPLPPRYEVNFRLPEAIAVGGHALRMRIGRRELAPVGIEVVA